MYKAFLDKLIESFKSVLPVTAVLILLGFYMKVETSVMLMFLLGALLLVVGLALFQLGAFESTSVIAEDIGRYIVKKRNLAIFIIVAFMLGFLIIVAEPSARVLADQLSIAIQPEMLLVYTIAIGVGLFLTVGLLRILFNISFRTLLIILYTLVFILALVVNQINPSFIPLAFDAGGFASGPLSVPFIMSLAYGISRARGDKASDQDSFGLVGITVTGPIFAILILGLFFRDISPDAMNLATVSPTLSEYLVQYTKDMAIAILPFIAFFVFFQIIDFRYQKQKVIKILIAFVYTYVGLVLFLTGANGAFSVMGTLIGGYFANNALLLILVGAVLGLLVAAPEPSVIAVNKQVEEVTAGAISSKLMLGAISIGVAVALILSMIRIVTQINLLWFVIPGYVLALVLMFFTPKMFSAIGFDSGSAVTGAMTTAFLMPFAIGAAIALDVDVLTNAYGLVVLASMAPVISIQVLGIVYARKQEVVEDYKGIDDIMDLSGVTE